jgi:hypothetical protein
VPSVANRLIEGLPRDARSRLLAMCELVELSLAQVLYDSDARPRHIYFPTGSTLSLWTTPGDLPVMEVAMVGNEGMLGSHVALGISTAATFAQVQEAGLALRMPVAHFKSELLSSTAEHPSVFARDNFARCVDGSLFTISQLESTPGALAPDDPRSCT